MFDQGAHLTAVLGIESIVDLDEKARSTLNNSCNFFARRLLSFYDMPMFTVSIIFELIQCLLIKNLPLSSAIFGETAE